jgi:hypothetical protein
VLGPRDPFGGGGQAANRRTDVAAGGQVTPPRRFNPLIPYVAFGWLPGLSWTLTAYRTGAHARDGLAIKTQRGGPGTPGGHRTFIAVVSAAVLVGGTGAVALPASASPGGVASPSGSTHTLKFIAVTTKTVVFSKTNTGRQDTDVRASREVPA